MSNGQAETRGRAALGLLESLLVLLEEKGVLTPEDVDDVFTAAIDAFRVAGREDHDRTGEAVAALLERIQSRGNGVRSR